MTTVGSAVPSTGAEGASSNGASGSDPDAIRAEMERTGSGTPRPDVVGGAIGVALLLGLVCWRGH